MHTRSKLTVLDLPEGRRLESLADLERCGYVTEFEAKRIRKRIVRNSWQNPHYPKGRS